MVGHKISIFLAAKRAKIRAKVDIKLPLHRARKSNLKSLDKGVPSNLHNMNGLCYMAIGKAATHVARGLHLIRGQVLAKPWKRAPESISLRTAKLGIKRGGL
jgi:hypothetical protein